MSFDVTPSGGSADKEGSERAGELAVGRVLASRYRITRELGRGGMGAVYEATGVRLGRRFAIKVPRTDRILHKDTLRRLEREASVGARLESSHIARVLDWDTLADGTPFVVMEYVPGEDLRRVLERTPTLPLRRAINLVLQACRGLAVAHAEGVIHRDLKPSNLALTPELGGHEHCTVLDFGVAKLADDLAGDGESTRTGAIVGTLAYMPAEQIRGDKTLDGRADVYALGAIFYECLAGRRAFEAPTHHELMYRILHERPTPLEQLRRELPPEVHRVVERAMATERGDRFEHVEAFAAALEGLLDAGGGMRSSSDTTLSSAILEPPRRVPRVPLSRTLATGALAGLLVTLGTYALSRNSAPATSAAPLVAPRAAIGTAVTPFVEPRAPEPIAAPARPAVPAPEPASPPAPARASEPRRSVAAKTREQPPAVVVNPSPPAPPARAPAGAATTHDPLTQRGYVLDDPYALGAGREPVTTAKRE